MKVTVLGTGSTGNATLVETEDTRLLVDAGFSGREVERRLAIVGIEPDSLTGILITHEHGDHTRGMGVLARRFDLPLYLTAATRVACRSLLSGKERLQEYRAAAPFRIRSVQVEPFLTAHDAADPVAVALTDVDRGHKLGIATDLGRPTATVRHALTSCHLLILEANHDEVMLRNGPYPWSVKQRIASSHGHLSNRAAAELAGELHHPDLGGVVLAHMSAECNDPGTAFDMVGSALERTGYRGTTLIGRQDAPLEPLDIGELRLKARAGEQLSLF